MKKNVAIFSTVLEREFKKKFKTYICAPATKGQIVTTFYTLQLPKGLRVESARRFTTQVLSSSCSTPSECRRGHKKTHIYRLLDQDSYVLKVLRDVDIKELIICNQNWDISVAGSTISE